MSPRRMICMAGFLLALVALEAAARPGGGNSYSGGSSRGSGGSSSGGSSYSGSSSSSSSSSRSGGGGGGGAGPVTTVLVLLIMIAWTGFVVRLGVREMAKQRQLNVGGREPPKPLPRKPPKDIRDSVVEVVRKHDPDFSLLLFEDFAYTLYAESHRARHDPAALARLAPYWTPEQTTALSKRSGGRVQAVVVGSLQPKTVSESGGQLSVHCSFETNLHLQHAPAPIAPVAPSLGELAVEAMKGFVRQPDALSAASYVGELLRQPEAPQLGAVTQYVEEVWSFSRDATVKTRPWTGVRTLGCPSCGAPYRSTADARCESCGQASGGGRFDWLVTSVVVRRQEMRQHSLTGSSEEVGTNAPTRFAPRVQDRRDELFRDDPAVTQASLESRLRLIYQTLQSAWAAQDLRPVRAFVSDRLYAYLQYWIDAYKEQGLRNLMDRPRFGKFVVARVERDAHYDAITVRFWAAGCDYTIEEKSGRVVGGSRLQERVYSEYWTLVRSAKVRGAPRLEKSCPACGAPLDINMAGQCEHCSTHVTSGEFDWVLSKIEQDEAYRG